MNIIYDSKKNKKLKKERGIDFETVIENMAKGEIILDFAHPNTEKYPDQRIMVVNIKDYPYCVPYIKLEDEIILKTVYPDRRFKKFLKEVENE